MAQQYNVYDSLKGVNGFGRQFPEIIYTARLAATTDTSFTVPVINTVGFANSYTTNQCLLIIRYGSPSGATNPSHVFVALNQTADDPNGATFEVDTSIINPDALVVAQGDVVHFFAVVANTDVSIEVWPIQG